MGGGTPILDFGKTCSRGDDITKVTGILNGTCNFILTKMERRASGSRRPCAQAQTEGYAETDPSLDVDGFDSAVKLAIIANHLSLSRATVKEVKVKGIADVSLGGGRHGAAAEGKALRLIATAETGPLGRSPSLLARDDPLCISGPLNAVKFHCRDSGPKVIVGKGAGGPETASSLLRDLIEIRGLMNEVSYAMKTSHEVRRAPRSPTGGRIRHVAALVARFAKGNEVVRRLLRHGRPHRRADRAHRGGEGGRRRRPSRRGSRQIRETHLRALEDAVRSPTGRRPPGARLGETLDQLEKLARGSTILREVTPRSRDSILSAGERLSNPIVGGALARHGGRVGLHDGRGGRDNDRRQVRRRGAADGGHRRTRSGRRWARSSSEGKVPVVTGYIGATQTGEITTIGRGGSDFTATMIASAIGADEVWIWSDVDGLMTADPKTVKEARVLSEVSYAEAGEMAVFGAKALHPRTLEPVAEKGIPVRFKNTFKPDSPGHGGQARPEGLRQEHREVGRARQGRRHNHADRGEHGRETRERGEDIRHRGEERDEHPDDLAERLRVEHQHGRRQAVDAAGRQRPRARRCWAREGCRQVNYEDDVCAVAVVGGGMRGVKGIAAKVFGAVAARGINVRMIAQGSSEQNISFVVHEDDGKEAVRAVHRAFRLDRLNVE